MASSDNVIRGCFTPKYIDRETLLNVRELKRHIFNDIQVCFDKLNTDF